MKCPDCKDGFYYPFVGPPEPCQTCAESHSVQDELYAIYVPKDSRFFFYREQSLGEILEINVLDYHLLATRFDGNKVIEYTDKESKEFQEIVSGRGPGTWWGNQYLVEHAEIGKAKFNYKPHDFVYHFHGPCEVTLQKSTTHNLTWYRKIMRQL